MVTNTAGNDRAPGGTGAAVADTASAAAAAAAAIETFAAQADEHPPQHFGFSYLDIASARRQAEALRLWSGSPTSRRESHPCPTELDLAGLVIPAKDLYPVAGMPTTYGARAPGSCLLYTSDAADDSPPV